MADLQTISDAQLTALKTLREQRPPPVKSGRGCILIVALPILWLIFIVLAQHQFLSSVALWASILGVTLVTPFWALRGSSRWARWRAQYHAVVDDQDTGRLRVTLPHEADGPTLIYRTLTRLTDSEELWLRPAQTVDVTLMSEGFARYQPTFSTAQLHYVLNTKSSPLVCLESRTVPLLGAQIRCSFDDWVRGSAWINAGTVQLRIGKGRLDPQQPELKRIWAAAASLFERLKRPKNKALRALAMDVRHPLDAARALAALAVDAPEVAAVVRTALLNDPDGAAWAQVACTGEGLMTSVSDALRFDVGRGVMGVAGPARDAILSQLQTVALEGDDSDLLTLAGLFEMAFVLTKDTVYQTRIEAAVRVMGSQGTASCLPWLNARRWSYGAPQALKALKARLPAGMVGALSTQAPDSSGGLSPTQDASADLTAQFHEQS